MHYEAAQSQIQLKKVGKFDFYLYAELSPYFLTFPGLGKINHLRL